MLVEKNGGDEIKKKLEEIIISTYLHTEKSKGILEHTSLFETVKELTAEKPKLIFRAGFRINVNGLLQLIKMDNKVINTSSFIHELKKEQRINEAEFNEMLEDSILLRVATGCFTGLIIRVYQSEIKNKINWHEIINITKTVASPHRIDKSILAPTNLVYACDLPAFIEGQIDDLYTDEEIKQGLSQLHRKSGLWRNLRNTTVASFVLVVLYWISAAAGAPAGVIIGGAGLLYSGSATATAAYNKYNKSD